MELQNQQLNPQFEGGLSRRSFIKRSTLTVGAITLLGQGLGLAGNDGYPGTSGTETKEVEHTVTVIVTVTTTKGSETTPSTNQINFMNALFPDNAHGSGDGKTTGSGIELGEPVITKQIIHTDAVLKSSNSTSTRTAPTASSNGAWWVMTITTVRTYVYGDP